MRDHLKHFALGLWVAAALGLTLYGVGWLVHLLPMGEHPHGTSEVAFTGFAVTLTLFALAYIVKTIGMFLSWWLDDLAAEPETDEVEP